MKEKRHVILCLIVLLCISSARCATSTPEDLVTIWMPNFGSIINSPKRSTSQHLYKLDVPRKTLFVFDVDKILMRLKHPLDPLHSAQATQRLDSQLTHSQSMTHNTPNDYELTNLGFVVAQLRILAIPFIALTNTSTGKTTLDSHFNPNMPCVIRYKGLKRSGFQTPFYDLVLTIRYRQQNGTTRYPVCYNGIWCTDHTEKGWVFKCMMQTLIKHNRIQSPHHIVMFDDGVECLHSVGRKCSQMQYPCTLIHWNEATAPSSLDTQTYSQTELLLGLESIPSMCNPELCAHTKLALFNSQRLKDNVGASTLLQTYYTQPHIFVVIAILQPQGCLHIGIQEILYFLRRNIEFSAYNNHVFLLPCGENDEKPFVYNGFLYTDGVPLQKIVVCMRNTIPTVKEILQFGF